MLRKGYGGWPMQSPNIENLMVNICAMIEYKMHVVIVIYHNILLLFI